MKMLQEEQKHRATYLSTAEGFDEDNRPFFWRTNIFKMKAIVESISMYFLDCKQLWKNDIYG